MNSLMKVADYLNPKSIVALTYQRSLYLPLLLICCVLDLLIVISVFN